MRLKPNKGRTLLHFPCNGLSFISYILFEWYWLTRNTFYWYRRLSLLRNFLYSSWYQLRKMLLVFYTSIAILFAKILQNMPIQCLSAWKTPITTKYQGNLHSFCSHLFTDKNLFYFPFSCFTTSCFIFVPIFVGYLLFCTKVLHRLCFFVGERQYNTRLTF